MDDQARPSDRTARPRRSPTRRRLRGVVRVSVWIVGLAVTLTAGVLIGIALGRDPTPATNSVQTSSIRLVTVTTTVAVVTKTIVVTG